MGASKPFNLFHAPLVPPVVCRACGNNAHCVRRQSENGKEIQTFRCTCGNEEVRIRGDEASDAAIQKSIEQRIEGGKI